MLAGVRVLVLRWRVTLLTHLVAVLLLAGSRRHRLQPVDDHTTRDGAKDQRAPEEDRSDHAKSVEEPSHQVITNYQRRWLTERSLESTKSRLSAKSSALGRGRRTGPRS